MRVLNKTMIAIAALLFCYAPLQALAWINIPAPLLGRNVPKAQCRLTLQATMDPMAGADLLPQIRESVVEADGEESWNNAATTLSSSAGIDMEEAELHLAEAFRWRRLVMCTSEIARKYIKPVVPGPDLSQSLLWLKDGPLGLGPGQIRDAIRISPEAYLVNPAKTYKHAMAAAPKPYKDPDAFRELCLKDPYALQCTYNCEDGGCASECGNCWVSYGNR
jgi:hypothetical protein